MVSQPGPMIFDAEGELVWMEDTYGQALDVKVQSYRGEQYLTFWTGVDSGTFGTGRYIMLDPSYQVYKTVTPANDLEGDLHEFEFTDNGTALVTSYHATTADLTPFGIASPGWVYDSIFQEIDVETGVLIFEWRASEHYDIMDTFARRPDSSDRDDRAIGRERKSAWDFFHINSIDKDSQGNYYVSSRYMHSITCIGPAGDILWVLGGKRNQFRDTSDGKATDFKFQHHARIHENNTLTIFDNGKYDSKSDNAEYSRGIQVQLDLEKMTATLVGEYVHPSKILVGSQGSVQLLPDSGHAVVGWGYVPAFTEFDSDGSVLCDVHIAPSITWKLGWVKNYRASRTSSWVGKPATQPDVYLRPREGKVYVSWNGATEVSRWLLQGREGQGIHVDLVSVQKKGFESHIEITNDMPTFVRVVALDKQGNSLGLSEELDRTVGNAPSEVFKIVGVGVFIVSTVFLAWVLRRWIPGYERVREVVHDIQNKRFKGGMLVPKRLSIAKNGIQESDEDNMQDEEDFHDDVERGLLSGRSGATSVEELQPLYRQDEA